MAQIQSKLITGKVESLTEQLLLLNPHQTPLLSLVGFSDEVGDTQHSWLEDEMAAFESKASVDAAIDATEITVVDASPFRTGDVVKVGEELLYISAVDAVGKKLTVARGYAGTTAAAINVDAKVELQFAEGNEGAKAREARYKARKRESNLTQIFDDSIDISGSAIASSHHGIDDLYEYEKQKKQVELALKLEKALINGKKYESGTVRQMSGIRDFIKTNVAVVNGDITLDVIEDQLQKIYETGGMQTGADYVVLVGAKQKRKISDFDKASLQVARDDQKRGTIANVLVTEFGEFPVALNNNIAPDEAFIVDLNRIEIKPLRGREFKHEYLGKVGDSVQGTIVGEFTLELHQEKAHARLKGLA
nr:MAG TPA: Major capsid protein [Caudoviricetes sp.]